MTFENLLKIWETQTDSPIQKLVLSALASFANGEDRAWPSISSLQRRTGLSDRSVQRELRKLAAKGMICVEKSGGGRHQVNTYRVILNPDTHTPNAIPRIRNGESQSKKGDTQSRNGDTVSSQLSGTGKELQGGRPAKKYVNELDIQIKTAEKEIQRIVDFGTPAEKATIKSLKEKKKIWTSQLMNS